MERILQRALEQKQQLEMIYLDQNGDYSQRIVRVVKIYEDDFWPFVLLSKALDDLKRYTSYQFYHIKRENDSKHRKA